MKSTLTWITGAALFAVLATPVKIIAREQEQQNAEHPLRYVITDLGPVGTPLGQPYVIAKNGLIAGAALIPGGAMHAVLWYKGLKFDIGALGGPNSVAFGVNEKGQAVGEAETPDPNGEDFCGFNAYGFPASSTACLPFLWQDAVMRPLPTLGGANGVANMINNRGEAVGYAEKKTQEKGCPVFQFEPVVWKDGQIQALHTYGADAVGVAAQINDKGQVVGSSGTCGAFNPNSGLYMVENHALLWENDGSVTDLGNLGGTGGLAGNHACAINNRGQVVGHSELSKDTTFHGFLWTREKHMQDLGTLDGDFASLALGINDTGAVVGASLAANFSSRAFLWKNGVMTDLNTLVPADSGLELQDASSIDSRGKIVGFGCVKETCANAVPEVHGFLATPCGRDHSDWKSCGDE